MTNFRILAKNVFITYPRCDLEKDVVLEQIRCIISGMAGTLVTYTIAKEDHQTIDDQGAQHTHFHVLLTFDRKVSIRDCRKFDLKAGESTFHGKVEGAKNFKNCLEYCKKDGDFISTHKDNNSDWGSLIDANSFDEFMDQVQLLHPRDAILHHNSIRAFAEYRFKKEINEYISPYTNESFALPVELDDWLNNEVSYYGNFHNMKPF